MVDTVPSNDLKESSRQRLKSEFLLNKGFKDYEIRGLPADASFRNYSRLLKDNQSFILMDCPPEHYSLQPFVTIGTHLLNSGFSAPKIYEQDHNNGFMILEDLGVISINHLLKSDQKDLEERIYKKIIRLLSEIQKISPPAELDVYSPELLRKEANVFLDWFLPIFNGEAPTEKQKEEYNVLWNKILSSINLSGQCLTLRDYHVDNLMYLEEREGINKIGLLDFQDAIIGSPAYDLVSLIEDARRDIAPAFANDLINYYLSLNSAFNRKDFLALYSILGAQRNFRILGVFARKATRDKNSQYLKYVPRVRKYLEKDLSHPLLAPLKEWLAKVASQQRS